ncbi:MAG: OsmC family protein [Bacteroidales bacterium]|nr:OsmC family protein [Bacteroidales bacterium]MDY0217038.1 OsmC family protein [Bacteroidales bacterium]
MKHKVETNWIGNMAFESQLGDHKIMLDVNSEKGVDDKGPRPKELLLSALGGCTAMDVISILKKMRVEVDYFNVAIEADLSEEHPKVYTKMHLIYQFKGDNLNEQTLKKAIDLSQDKYCGVSAMFRKAMELTYEIQILN